MKKKGIRDRFYFTTHAKARGQQRGITMEDIKLVVKYGVKIYRLGGKQAYLMTGKSVQRGFGLGLDLSKLRGYFVLIGKGGTVVTAFRQDRRVKFDKRRSRKDKRAYRLELRQKYFWKMKRKEQERADKRREASSARNLERQRDHLNFDF